MVDREEVLLPQTGESIEMDWGLETIRGRVVESYSTGSRPRVVVEIEAGEVSENSTTVAVPVEAVNPVGPPKSTWAQWRRYESEVIRAINRVTSRRFGFEAPTRRVADGKADAILNIGDEHSIAILMKFSRIQPAQSDLVRQIHQVHALVESLNKGHLRRVWLGLLIVDHAIPRGLKAGKSQVESVCWRDSNDDPILRESIYSLLSASDWRDPAQGARFEIYPDRAGKFRFRLKAGNGEVLMAGEAYETSESAQKSANLVRSAIQSAADDGDLHVRKSESVAKFELYIDKAGKFRFRLKSADGEILAASDAHETREAALRQVKLIRGAAVAAA